MSASEPIDPRQLERDDKALDRADESLPDTFVGDLRDQWRGDR